MLDIIKFLETYTGAVTALATVAIGLFTFALVVVTNRQARLTRDAANAAKLGAEALISSERAHLFVIIKGSSLQDALHAAVWYPNSPDMDDSFISRRPAVEFSIKNLGKTAAIMTEVSYQLSQGPADQSEWNYEIRDTIVDPVIEGGEETAPPTPCAIEVATFLVRDARAAMDRTRPLFFYGYVSFLDTFNRRHRYFWRYENSGMRFVLVYQDERQTDA